MENYIKIIFWDVQQVFEWNMREIIGHMKSMEAVFSGIKQSAG